MRAWNRWRREHPDLGGAQSLRALLHEAYLADPTVAFTRLSDIDLSEVRGLDRVRQVSPSTIGVDTICRSKGSVPEVFLRGAAVPGTFIYQVRSWAGYAIDYYSCFIAYWSRDQDLPERLHSGL